MKIKNDRRIEIIIDGIIKTEKAAKTTWDVLQSYGIEIKDIDRFDGILKKYRSIGFPWLLYGEGLKNNKMLASQFQTFLEYRRAKQLMRYSKELNLELLKTLTWDNVQMDGINSFSKVASKCTLVFKKSGKKKTIQLDTDTGLVLQESDSREGKLFPALGSNHFNTLDTLDSFFVNELSNKIKIDFEYVAAYKKIAGMQISQPILQYFTIVNGRLELKKNYKEEVIKDNSREMTRKEVAIYNSLKKITEAINDHRKKYNPDFMRRRNYYTGIKDWEIYLIDQEARINEEIFSKLYY